MEERGIDAEERRGGRGRDGIGEWDVWRGGHDRRGWREREAIRENYIQDKQMKKENKAVIKDKQGEKIVRRSTKNENEDDKINKE